MSEAISKSGNGLLITLDEVQDAELGEVRTLSVAIQQIIGEDLDIAFVFAGLSSMIESVIKGKTLTFLRRALPFDLKAVAETEVSYSLEETIETSGMELKPGIAGQLAEATQGYPFIAHWILRMATGTTCPNKCYWKGKGKMRNCNGTRTLLCHGN